MKSIKQIIKEEIIRILNEVEAKFKKGETVMYMGEKHEVISDNGYVVKLERSNGKTITLNHKQVKEKVRRPEDFLNEKS